MADDDSSGGIPPWMVTFSDCMTLLLCFFVLLISFSSFEPQKRQRLMTSITSINYTSIFSEAEKATDSHLPPPPQLFDQAAEGSDRHTEQPLEEQTHPKDRKDILDSDAFRDKRRFTIPSAKLFIGQGPVLRGDADALVRKIAGYLRLLPGCTIVVAESRSATPGPAGEIDLQRSWALMDALRRATGKPDASQSHRFSVAGTDPGAVRPGQPPEMVITVLNRRASR